MNQKVYLIDGSGYIFRAYFAIRQSLSNKDGLPTNALYGFTRMLLKFLRELQEENGEPPLHIAMVFDAARKNYRHDLYSEYKANREECPEDLVPQMPYFRKLATALGFPVFEQEGFEADDLIASFVRSARESGREVIIVSGDKDLTQLVSKDVVMWDPMRDITFNEEKVREQFGVPPSLIKDYLSLVGDSSDNIPGAKGIGPKTAAQLLSNFKSLESLLEKLDEVSEMKGLRGSAGIQKKLESSQEMIRLSAELVRLEDSIEVNIDDALWNGFNEGELSSLLDTLEFRSLFEDLSVNAPSNKDKNKDNPGSGKEYRLIDVSELKSLLKSDPPEDFFGFDTETTSLNPMDAKLIGVSVSWKPQVAFYIKTVDSNGDLLADEVNELADVLNSVLNNKKITKCGSNLKYDIRVLAKYGFKFAEPFFDTMIASYVLHPDGRENGLKPLTLKHLGEEMVTFKELLGEYDDILSVSVSKIAKYAAHDADSSYRLSLLLKDKLQEESGESSPQWKVFKDIEMPLVMILAQMEDNGVKVDVDILKDLEDEFSGDLKHLTEKIHEEAGEEFNINSPKQLSQILFDKLELPVIKKTQSGYSTNVSVLNKLQGSHPIIDHILLYREIHKLLTTYVQSLGRLINPETGRIHASFNQAVAATGRLSSSDPNLQNIPIRTTRGKRLREIFVAEEASSLVIADYSQIELRVLAHLSEDEALCQAFLDGEDIHSSTAYSLFGEEAENDISKYRRIAKTINFGILYGMGAYRLSGDLGVSRKEAQEFIDKYFARYPKVKLYFDKIKSEAEDKGYVETMFGRRRYAADLDVEGRDRGYAARSMMNAPIQGTAAEIVKYAMIRLSHKLNDSYGSEVKLVLQVHDELIFEVPDESSEKVSEIVKVEMENAVELRVPLRAEILVGKNWGK